MTTIAVEIPDTTPSDDKPRWNWWTHPCGPGDETRVLRVGDPSLEQTVQLPLYDRPLRLDDGEQTVSFAHVMYEEPGAGYRIPVEYDGRLKPRGLHKDRWANTLVTSALLALTVLMIVLSIAWGKTWLSRETSVLGLAAVIFTVGIVVSFRRQAAAWGWARRTVSIIGMAAGILALGIGSFWAVSEHILNLLDAWGVWIR